MSRSVVWQRRRRMVLVAATLLVAAVTLAACSSGSSTGATVDSSGSPYGTILVDSSGHTLYAFLQDTATQSRCTGTCAHIWPPLVTNGQPKAGNGVDSSLLSTLTLPDGSKQVSYAGHPLYSYESDTAAGQTHGQGVSGFFVITTSGFLVRGSSPGPTPTVTTAPPRTTTTTPSSSSTTKPTTTTSTSTSTTTSTTTTTTTAPSGGGAGY